MRAWLLVGFGTLSACHLLAGFESRQFGPVAQGGAANVGGDGGGVDVGGGGESGNSGGAGGNSGGAGGVPLPCTDCTEEEICKVDHCDPVVTWALKNGEDDTNGIRSVATTPAGGVVVAGQFNGTLDFPVAIGDLISTKNAGFLAEYNENGVPLMARDFEPPASGQVYDGQVAATQGAFLFGASFSDSLTLDVTLNSSGPADFDGFIAHMDTNGTVNWSKQFTGSSQQYVGDVAFDANGNVYVAGYGNDGCIVEGETATGPCLFVASYNGNGTLRWSTVVSTGYADNVALAVGDGVYVLASYDGSAIDIGGPQDLSGTTDQFLVKYELAGSGDEPVFGWAKNFETNDTFNIVDIAADETGVVVTGPLVGTLACSTLGAGALDFTAVANDTLRDVFIASFAAADGQVRHQEVYGDTALQIPGSIALSAGGQIVTAGYYTGTLDFGGGELVSDADDDMYFAVLEANGTHRWSYSLPVAGGSITPNGVAANATVSFVGGGFSGTFEQGPDMLTATDTSLFLARIGL